MELQKQIYDEIVRRLDPDEDTLKIFTNETVMFDTDDGNENLGLDSIDALELVTLIYDKWGIEERHCLRRRCGPASFCMRNGSVL